MTLKKTVLTALVAATVISPFVLAAEAPSPSSSTETPAARDERMRWWREARFGMFIHYGLYAGLEGDNNGKPVSNHNTEWHQKRMELDTDSYAKLALPKFKPSPGAAAGWAAIAREAGCKYVVLTTKHHEGFDLFESKVNDFDLKDKQGRDLVKEYVDALHAEGLRVGFYHSLIDWHNPDYDFRAAKGLPYPDGGAKLAGDTPRDQNKYIEFLHTQVGELLSNYGKVDVLWFDYSSAAFDGDKAWDATALMREIHAKQPGIIVNNRLYASKTPPPPAGMTDGIRYGDFSTPEKNIPANGLPGKDWETCMTLNDTWGYSKHDHSWKSVPTLVRMLCDTASKGGNLLLNIGPRADGSLSPETRASMAGIGAWLRVNGDAIYGTDGSPFEKQFPWGRVTRKGGTLFLLVFDRPKDGVISLPLNNGAGASAKLLAGGEALATETGASALRVTLPEKLPDEIATVVVVKLAGSPVVSKP